MKLIPGKLYRTTSSLLCWIPRESSEEKQIVRHLVYDTIILFVKHFRGMRPPRNKGGYYYHFINPDGKVYEYAFENLKEVRECFEEIKAQ